MYDPITIPADCKMLLNRINLKDGVKIEDIELLLGEMCHIVKENYGDDNGGFVAGQVFSSAGFISSEGSLNTENKSEDDIILVTYWRSFEQHESSHADAKFSEKFNELAKFCDKTDEIGYNLLWQGMPE